MNRGFYLQTSLIEERHWWFVERRRLVAALVAGAMARGGGGQALDIGCGTGGNLTFLGELCPFVAGLDLSGDALELARSKRRGDILIRADANEVGALFRESSFDLITLFNLLYHRWIRDEARLLEQAARLLRPGGLLLATEPAFEILMRRHDVIGYGARRYRRAGLKLLFERAGLEVRLATYFNGIAFLPALLRAIGERLLGRLSGAQSEQEGVSEMKVPPPALNGFLGRLAALEGRFILAGGRVPFGAGLLILAAKPEEKDGDVYRTAVSGTA